MSNEKSEYRYDEDEVPTVAGEHYSEDTPLLWVLGDEPKVKILAALLSERNQAVTITDISRMAGLSRSAIYDHIDPLLDYSLVRETRKVGNSRMFRIDLEHDGGNYLAALEQWLLRQEVEDE